MKVLTDTNPAFKPVTIVLETQEEVDHLYSWMNNVIVSPESCPLGKRAHREALEPYTNMPNANALHDEINDRMRAFK